MKFKSLYIYTIMLVIMTGCTASNSVGSSGKSECFKFNSEDVDKATADTLTAMLNLIKAERDTAYLYEYEGTRFVPPEGKALYTLGISQDDIINYSRDFSDEPDPAGWVVTWAVTDTFAINTDTRSDIKKKVGNNNHQWIVDNYPGSVLSSAMWQVGTWGILQNTVDGKNDDNIRYFCRWVKTIQSFL